MSIESDIVTALAAFSYVYPEGEVPEGVDRPLVTYRRTLYDHPQFLQGSGIGLVHSEFTFECWAEKTRTASAKAGSLAIAIAVRAALEASAALTAANRFEIPTPGDQYEPEVLAIMEPVSYSFWHAP